MFLQNLTSFMPNTVVTYRNMRLSHTAEVESSCCTHTLMKPTPCTCQLAKREGLSSAVVTVPWHKRNRNIVVNTQAYYMVDVLAQGTEALL
jgi:hypothetical protein